MTTFKFKKAVQALNYFAEREGGKLNYMKAVKLVWLSDRAHVRNYGRTITNDQYFAMKNGTVPSATKDIVSKSAFFDKEVIDYSNQFLSDPSGYSFESLKKSDLKVFSKSDINVMAEIYDNFGKLNEFELSEYSHQFPEWIRFEKDLKSGIGKSFPIFEEDFFENGLVDKPFAQSPELLALSKEHFQELA